MLKFSKTLPVGLQVYSVRDYASKDLEGTMKKLKEIGYDYVEPAGLYGNTAEEYRAVLDRCGIKAICAHVPYAEMVEDIDKVIADYKTLGVCYIAVPYLGEDDRPGAKNFETVLENIRKIGKKLAENGITLLYHNHDFEFVKMPDGRYGLDYMYDTVDADTLQTELDCCWVNVGGEDPAAYIRKYANRCPVVHLKDFTGSKSKNMYNLIGMKEVAETTAAFAFRPVGYGKQDIPTIITAAIESGAEYLVVEQDNPGEQTSLEAVEMSRNYLKTLGF
ncbi:MAG: sugar phosphate isomerase/epimerase [Clostridia bacterium]|nr:sugar phosphate isomerase/epimerase [Clostridia bacterium]